MGCSGTSDRHSLIFNDSSLYALSVVKVIFTLIGVAVGCASSLLIALQHLKYLDRNTDPKVVE